MFKYFVLILVLYGGSIYGQTVDQVRQAAYSAYGQAAASQGIAQISVQETMSTKQSCETERTRIINQVLNNGSLWQDAESLMILADSATPLTLITYYQIGQDFTANDYFLKQIDSIYWMSHPIARMQLIPEYQKITNNFLQLKQRYDNIKQTWYMIKSMYDTVLTAYKQIVPQT